MPRPSKAGSAKSAPAKKAASGKAATSAKTAKTAKKVTKKAAAPPPRKTASKAAPVKKSVATKAAAKKSPAPVKKAPAPAKKAVTTARKAPAAPVKKTEKKAAPAGRPPKGSPADKFYQEQEVLLLEERQTYVEQAEALKAEADQLAADMEPGDVQFDEESGEGMTATVDRERDLALSAQARNEVEEIDHALGKLKTGTYGTCENCGQPIPKPRLKAIPHARLCVACKSGGLSRR